MSVLELRLRNVAWVIKLIKWLIHSCILRNKQFFFYACAMCQDLGSGPGLSTGDTKIDKPLSLGSSQLSEEINM